MLVGVGVRGHGARAVAGVARDHGGVLAQGARALVSDWGDWDSRWVICTYLGACDRPVAGRSSSPYVVPASLGRSLSSACVFRIRTRSPEAMTVCVFCIRGLIPLILACLPVLACCCSRCLPVWGQPASAACSSRPVTTLRPGLQPSRSSAAAGAVPVTAAFPRLPFCSFVWGLGGTWSAAAGRLRVSVAAWRWATASGVAPPADAGTRLRSRAVVEAADAEAVRAARTDRSVLGGRPPHRSAWAAPPLPSARHRLRDAAPSIRCWSDTPPTGSAAPLTGCRRPAASGSRGLCAGHSVAAASGC